MFTRRAHPAKVPNGAIQRRVREKEKYHNRHCTKLWWFENPLGKRFVFGLFVRDRDSLIVTIAAFVKHVGWLSQ